MVHYSIMVREKIGLVTFNQTFRTSSMEWLAQKSWMACRTRS